MKPIRFPISLLATFLATSQALASTVTISLEDAHRSKLNEAFDDVHAGRPAKAEAIFSAVIAAYDRDYAGLEVRCAEDLRDAAVVGMLASLIGAQEKISSLTEGMKAGERKISADEHVDVTVLGPGWCQAIFGKAFVLIDLNRPAEADPLLAKVVVMAPTKAHYLNEYAERFKSRREWQWSYDLFARASELARKGPDAADKKVEARSLRGMGFNKIELGDLDEAERLFELSLEIEPGNSGALSELKYIAEKRNGVR
jgi:tetratricopeptide (TPR) repeat protein